MAVNVLRRLRRGVAAMEFALTLPVFLFVVLGVADLSYFITSLYDVQRAARDGARVGSVTLEGGTPTGAVINAEAIAQAKQVLLASGKPCGEGCSVTSTWVLVEGFRYVQVNVTYPHRPFTPGLHLVPTYARASFFMLTQQQ